MVIYLVPIYQVPPAWAGRSAPGVPLQRRQTRDQAAGAFIAECAHGADGELLWNP